MYAESENVLRPAAEQTHALITAAELKAAINDGRELAILDVREQGAFALQHLLFASVLPLGRIELLVDRLVPNRSARIVLTDLDESLAPLAASKLRQLGYREVAVLQGGTQGWAQAGFEVFSGTNVPSKALGEVVEHQLGTPHISASELKALVDRGDDVVVVDSRPFDEFQRMSIPGAVDCPGAELVYRIQGIAPDPQTLVVVNCAGRTRSIVGAQTLIDAGIPNRVVSLKDGTMAWLLAGFALDSGKTNLAGLPDAKEAVLVRDYADSLARRAGVVYLDDQQLAAFEAEQASHTLYKFDVRSPDEYAAGHLPGWRSAPGGQLVQALDEYVGVRRSRIVLADWDGVRAVTAAAWLIRLGGYEVYLYRPDFHSNSSAASSSVLESGAEPLRVLRIAGERAPWIEPTTLQRLLAQGSVLVFDVDSSLAYRSRHLPGAYFATPEKLRSAIDELARPGQQIAITSQDGVLAQAVATQLRSSGVAEVHALLGGTARWLALGLPAEAGDERNLSGEDDAWYGPYAYPTKAERERRMNDYLAWEIGLVEQLRRDGDSISRPLFAEQGENHD